MCDLQQICTCIQTSPFVDREEGRENSLMNTPPTNLQETDPGQSVPRDQRMKRTPIWERKAPGREGSPPPAQPPQPLVELSSNVVDLAKTESNPSETSGGKTTKVSIPHTVAHYRLTPINLNILRSSVQTRLQTKPAEHSPPASPPSPKPSSETPMLPDSHLLQKRECRLTALQEQNSAKQKPCWRKQPAAWWWINLSYPLAGTTGHRRIKKNAGDWAERGTEDSPKEISGSWNLYPGHQFLQCPSPQRTILRFGGTPSCISCF